MSNTQQQPTPMKTPPTTDDNAPATEDAQPGKDPRAARIRAFCAVRIQDYRLQALAHEDPDHEDDAHMEWTEIGSATMIDTDRERVYQLARANGGLLLPVQGLCTASGIAALKDAARRLVEFTASKLRVQAPKPVHARSLNASNKPSADSDEQPY